VKEVLAATLTLMGYKSAK